MADVKCTVCGDPWEIDTIHDVVEERYPHKPWLEFGQHNQAVYEHYFNIVWREFRDHGCKALGAKCNTTKANPALFEIAEVLGDDIDAYASMIEDFGL